MPHFDPLRSGLRLSYGIIHTLGPATAAVYTVLLKYTHQDEGTHEGKGTERPSVHSEGTRFSVRLNLSIFSIDGLGTVFEELVVSERINSGTEESERMKRDQNAPGRP